MIVENVPSTGGTVEILKHYLPRMGPELGGDPWWNWPLVEQVAIGNFFEVLWHRDRRSDVPTADETLCAIGRVAPDIRPYLDAWSEDSDPAAAENLRLFPGYNTEESWSGGLFNAYWDDENEPAKSNRARLLDWLHEART